jgi:hypothetical protein
MKGMLELQLTCGALHDSQIPLFVATCEQVGLRPLLIDHHHPQPHPHPHAHPHAHPDAHGHPPGGPPPGCAPTWKRPAPKRWRSRNGWRMRAWPCST